MSNIDYGGGQDFRSKMKMFGAKLDQQQNGQQQQNHGGYNRPKAPPRPQQENNNQYGGNSGYQRMQQDNNSGSIKPSGGFSNGNSNQQRAPRKILVKSKAARATGRNEHAIKVNLDSVKSKVKFGRLVVYSVNCLGTVQIPQTLYIPRFHTLSLCDTVYRALCTLFL